MEYTELADYPMPAGDLTAWLPTAAPEAWTDDPRRLSYMHLEHSMRAVDEGSSWYSEWIGTAFLIKRPLDRRAFDEALLQWHSRHEAFRSSVRVADEPHSEDDLQRITVPQESITITESVIGAGLTEAQVHASITEFFNSTISPLRWPHLIAVTVEPTDRDDQFLVVFAADHTVMDAYTQVFAIKELTTLYESALTGEPSGLHSFGSYVDFSDAERTIGDQIDANNAAVAQWRRFFDTAVPGSSQPNPMPSFPLITYTDDGEPLSVAADRGADPGYQTTLSSWLFDAAETKKFNDICKAAGSSMTAGIYTALSMTNAALSGDPELRFISPVHTRSAMEWGEAAGWFVGIVPVHLRAGGATTFGEALAAIGDSSGEFKDVGSAPYAPIADLLETEVQAPGLVISYIDLRAASGADKWAEQRARVLRSATRDGDEVYFWINRIPFGTNVSARFPSDVTGEDVQRFLSTFKAILQQVLTEGDAPYVYADPEAVAALRAKAASAHSTAAPVQQSVGAR